MMHRTTSIPNWVSTIAFQTCWPPWEGLSSPISTGGVERRRDHNRFYRSALGDLAGVEFMPEIPSGESTFWLTTLTIEPAAAGTDRETVRLALEAENIEARPVWKPMHLQPYYASAERVGGDVSQQLFEIGLCLPSGSTLSDDDRARIAAIVRETFGKETREPLPAARWNCALTRGRQRVRRCAPLSNTGHAPPLGSVALPVWCAAVVVVGGCGSVRRRVGR